MDSSTVMTITQRAQNATTKKLCPQCNSKMVVTDSLREGNFIFTWYSCPRDDCDGQWMSKTRI